ncbi:MAG: ABC transporter ATP-binding protein [Mycoplasmoidaceae bacterium]|nr:ABC transporter ATP-binding protein [Mycoplasmoidaceae bacterium]
MRINNIQNKIESYEGYINDLKSSFFTKYHAEQVRKLEHIEKNHGVKEMNSKYVIDLKNIAKYYNNGVLATKVLKDVDLQIYAGEFVVILGPSGSGKTTLLNIISGMDTATYGTAVVCGNNLTNLNKTELTEFRRKNIGYVFQQYGLLPNLSIEENVEIGANLQTDKEKRIDIDDLLKTIGIYEHRNKFPSELSGGQQQRVSIARSIAKNPSIIFGDEPTGAIDETMSKQVMQLFLDINKKYKTTIIIVTHNPIFAEMATMVINVSDGKISKITHNKNPKAVKDLN